MNFDKLNIQQPLIENLQKVGYNSMTPIQQEALPHILKNKDVLAQAQTGSGKTATFGIALLNKLDVKLFRVQSLILCPTRELAQQVAKELRVLAKFKHNIKILLLCGGESFGKQLNSLSHQAHIIVATPGRVLKHLNKKSLNLEHLNTLVLDEADRMLDMGFLDEVSSVMEFTPTQKQTLLFSATYTDDILELSKTLQKDVVFVKVESQESKLIQKFFKVEDKFQTLLNVLTTFSPKNVIVFSSTKVQTDEIANQLQKHNIDALSLHGDLEQYERNDVLIQFSNGSCRVLVATDVASRGLDISELSMVVNYDMPYEKEIYTHRVGRTARKDKSGISISFYTDEEEIQGYEDIVIENISTLKRDEDFSMKSPYISLVIEGGKKDKLRAMDIVGALTNNSNLKGADIGDIDIYDKQSYVAIKSELIDEAYEKLRYGKIKNKKFSIWIL